jgi:hypothetical protein
MVVVNKVIKKAPTFGKTAGGNNTLSLLLSLNLLTLTKTDRAKNSDGGCGGVVSDRRR